MPPLQRTPNDRQRGFTLVELVMVIVILGVIGGVIAVFMKSPVDAYFDSVRRAGLTDVADTTVRRIARDLHKSLPNSIRNPTGGSQQCLEFIPTKTGGRYRAQEIATGDDTSLNFGAADTTFNMLGSNSTFAGNPLPVDQQIATNDLVAIYNLGITGSNAYAGDNTAVLSGVGASGAETAITFFTGKQFPLTSPAMRFHVIPGAEQVVGYVCTGGTLRRYVRSLPYAAPAGCPLAAAVAASPALARNVASCNFDYSGSDLQRNALVRIVLELTDSGETVTLQHEVHVNNTP